jgi:hypothetical protein
MRKSKLFIIFFLNILLIANFTTYLQSDFLNQYHHDLKLSLNQEDSWATVMNENRIYRTKIKILNNNCIYVVGDLEIHNTYLTIFRYNSSGIKFWEYSWVREENSQLYDLIIDSENFLYIVGTIRNYTTHSWDIFLLKVNASGELIWSKIFNPYTECYRLSIAIDLNNSLYISGSDYYYDEGLVRNVFLIKLDDSGDILWDRVINVGEISPEVIEMHTDSKNNVLLYIGTDISSQHLIKYNSSGNTIWHKEWGEDDGFGRSKVIENDNILVTGITYYQSNDTFDAWIMKINSSGFSVNITKIGNFGDNMYDWWGSIWYYDDNNNVYFLISDHLGCLLLTKYNSNLVQSWNSSLNCYPQEEIYSVRIRCNYQQEI